MILDTLNNASQYDALHLHFEEGFRFIQEQAATLPAGRYELSGGAYVLVQEYETQPAQGISFEAHRRYIDIQYVAQGHETIYYANLERLEAGEYQLERDFLPLEGKGSPLYLQAGDFAIFYPQDAHLPSRVTPEGSSLVKKVVVKIPV